MLHMVVATHGPESCPASRKDIREAFLAELRHMGQAAAALGATVVGSWSDMAGHAIYLVVDAPDAHAVNQLAADIRLMDWSTVDINPIVELTEAVDRIGKREAFL